MGYVLRRHLAPFGIAFGALTSLMLVNQVIKQVPGLVRSGASAATISEVLLLTLPFTIALTLPMAVLAAVLRVFTQLEPDPALSLRRLVTLVLGAAACVALLALVFQDQVLPRANHRLRQRLVEVRHDPPGLRVEGLHYKGDREMTLSELRRAARTAREEATRMAAEGLPSAEQAGRQRAAMYDVEIQKKYAVAAACFVFALFGAPVGLLFRRGGIAVVIALCFAVFALYYIGLIGGEELGDRRVVSPFVSMWVPNLVVGLVGVIGLWGLRGKPPALAPSQRPA